jgi:DNA-binding transcriptional ArsR family regulator
MNVLFEALAHPTRREILAMLKHGSASAGDIAARFNVVPRQHLWPRFEVVI